MLATKKKTHFKYNNTYVKRGCRRAPRKSERSRKHHTRRISEHSTTRDKEGQAPAEKESRHGEGVSVRNTRAMGNDNGRDSEERQSGALLGTPSPPRAGQRENARGAYGRPERHPAARIGPCRHRAAPTPQGGRPPGRLTPAGRVAGLQTRAETLVNDQSRKGCVL